jgi:hypothetical protein
VKSLGAERHWLEVDAFVENNLVHRTSAPPQHHPPPNGVPVLPVVQLLVLVVLVSSLGASEVLRRAQHQVEVFFFLC